MDEYNVNIAIPPAKDKSDLVTVVGSKAHLERAIEALKGKVAEIEAENEDRVRYFDKIGNHWARSSYSCKSQCPVSTRPNSPQGDHESKVLYQTFILGSSRL